MKSIIISSNCSGGGKTTFTLALMKALINRGYSVQGYKSGPDYIDTAFHTHLCKKASRNLDLFLMGEEGVKTSFSKGQGDIGIIEGAMGLYDGLGYDSKCSTYDLSKVLNLPIILVITPKAQSNTLCAELLGLINYENANIKGVVLNNISEGYYKLLKKLIEKNTPLKVFGYLPKNERIILGSRHLGLIQSSEIENLDKKINLSSKILGENVDVEGIINSLDESEEYNRRNANKQFEYIKSLIVSKPIRIAYAYDKAFSFYYKDNLELFERVGELIPFSPLEDKKLPEDIDFLYIGGGYPEVFEKELSNNHELLKDIKDKLENGLPTYAECGGLMYLTEGSEKNSLVGFFDGIYKISNSLVNFGYAELQVENENHIFHKGLKIHCHEFHKSYIETKEPTVFCLSKNHYEEEKQWKCGYVKNNVIAAYAHIHFYSNMEFFNNLLRLVHKTSQVKQSKLV
ncbi:cobyrinic acid A,C-diamide synthase [Clostridium homopropionicum DSM 5847]|uniref:Cobyrinate a,c-diamide synthase n=1 Tax=Clostridium homopropionicum DSM 5847 TaxID=1121318 RepID=A0A0L6Z9W7_9CLOT|nr:cobyrinate a,c-diamide synthase [Clostridium homopropionicum]KOA19760.1 cobyrinic acid A,C-diamide synthase [Clostridium homopropionicum DSM 5847]SFF78115.1 cobyrinic acid a,c-diamide synthase [Clostridium homopropionicum]